MKSKKNDEIPCALSGKTLAWINKNPDMGME